MFFRKEADLLVVSQAACSMPRVIFWFATDFPSPAQVNIGACTVSKLRMVSRMCCANSNVEVSVIDVCNFYTLLLTKPQAQSVLKGLG